jgi:hypothetical protein
VRHAATAPATTTTIPPIAIGPWPQRGTGGRKTVTDAGIPTEFVLHDRFPAMGTGGSNAGSPLRLG